MRRQQREPVKFRPRRHSGLVLPTSEQRPKIMRSHLAALIMFDDVEAGMSKQSSTSDAPQQAAPSLPAVRRVTARGKKYFLGGGWAKTPPMQLIVRYR